MNIVIKVSQEELDELGFNENDLECHIIDTLDKDQVCLPGYNVKVEDSKKWYFISFDFWCNAGAFNKFHTSVLKADLQETNLDEIVQIILRDHNSELDTSNITIKINSFNLV